MKAPNHGCLVRVEIPWNAETPGGDTFELEGYLALSAFPRISPRDTGLDLHDTSGDRCPLYTCDRITLMDGRH